MGLGGRDPTARMHLTHPFWGSYAKQQAMITLPCYITLHKSLQSHPLDGNYKKRSPYPSEGSQAECQDLTAASTSRGLGANNGYRLQC